MKKIFYIANIRLPTEKAHGVQIMKTCEAFAKAGVDVTLVVPRRFNFIKTDPFQYYDVAPNFTIAKVPTLDLVKFGRLGFFIETVIFSECTVWYIRSMCFKNKITEKIVYSRDTWPLLNVSLLGWKLFWEAHMGSKSVLTKTLLQRLTGLVTISHGLKNLYVGLGFAKEKILVAPDAIDLKKFGTSMSREKSRTKLGLSQSKKIAMYIGLLDAWKGYRTFLETSKQLTDEDIQIVVIGGTAQQIASLHIEFPQVIFLGCREYTELPENQKAADVLVIPNSGKFLISKYYTSPLKLFAHMASGIPIIAADLPSIREIVSDAEVNFFTPDDVTGLVQVIQKTLKDSWSEQRALRARELVSRFTWDTRGREIIKYIQSHV